MSKIKCYRDWAPTGLDCKGLGLENRQAWIVAPVSRTRDSGILDESNFDSAIKILESAGVEYETHEFGHWACGWIEIALVHPDCADTVREIADRLGNSPVLDDDDHSEREYAAICEAWAGMSLRDRIAECAREGASIFAARRDEIPAELSDSGRCYAWITQ